MKIDTELPGYLQAIHRCVQLHAVDCTPDHRIGSGPRLLFVMCLDGVGFDACIVFPILQTPPGWSRVAFVGAIPIEMLVGGLLVFRFFRHPARRPGSAGQSLVTKQ